MVSAWRFEGGGSATAPVGAVALYGTRRASSTMLCSMRLPPTGSAVKPLAMLRWVRPDQIVMLKLLRESRSKNLDFFATFFAIRDCSELSNQGLRCKSAGKSVSLRSVFALRGRKRAPNRKKSCKDAAIFVFTMGGLPQRIDIAMGSGA